MKDGYTSRAKIRGNMESDSIETPFAGAFQQIILSSTSG